MAAVFSPANALLIAGLPKPVASLVPLQLTETLSRPQTLATPTPTLALAGVRDTDTPTRPSQELPSLEDFKTIIQNKF